MTDIHTHARNAAAETPGSLRALAYAKVADGPALTEADEALVAVPGLAGKLAGEISGAVALGYLFRHAPQLFSRLDALAAEVARAIELPEAAAWATIRDYAGRAGIDQIAAPWIATHASDGNDTGEVTTFTLPSGVRLIRRGATLWERFPEGGSRLTIDGRAAGFATITHTEWGNARERTLTADAEGMFPPLLVEGSPGSRYHLTLSDASGRTCLLLAATAPEL